MVSTFESDRYREAAEYTTTVAAAKRIAGKVSAAHCLAYEEIQFAAVSAKQVFNPPPRPGESPEHLTPEHPDYARRWEEKKAAASTRLHTAYESLTQELNDKLAAAMAVPAPDKGILTARRLKASARLLLDSYAEYLTMVAGGELKGESDLFSRIRVASAPDNGARKAAAGAAELAHFRRLLFAFDVLEGSHPAAVAEAPRPAGSFIEEYRRALSLLKQAHDSPADVVPDTLEADLLLLAQQQTQRTEAAILDNQQTGRGLVLKNLRDALAAEPYALAVTHQVAAEIKLNEAYGRILDDDLPRAIYHILSGAIGGLLDLLGTYFPEEFAAGKLAVDYKVFPIVELAKQYGPPHLRIIAKQRTATPAKGSPAADVRRYFPAVAAIHGTEPTNENALHQLAIWLLHWGVRANNGGADPYSLPGQLTEQMQLAGAPGKFLKAAWRLHEALAELAATERPAKQLLGKEYTPAAADTLRQLLTWWAGWLREQTEIQTNPAGAYLAALQRVSLHVDQSDGSPRYKLNDWGWGSGIPDYEGFQAEIRPYREAFEAALPSTKTGQKRTLRAQFGELLKIDRASLVRRQAQFERQEYPLKWLADDYDALRFDVADRPGGLSGLWVHEFFWSGLRDLLQFKQEAARAAFDRLNAALGESLPAPGPPAPAATASTGSNGKLSANWELSVENLCCQGFTPNDLTKLLQRLSVVDSKGNCLTNDLKGRARGQKGAFTAAYRTLHRAGLLAPTAKDKEWADVLRKQYGANLGADVIAHRLTPAGHAPKSAPGPFQKAVSDANEWIGEWLSSR